MSLSRLTLPQAFLDKLSDKILLPPEPDYFYANLIFGAVAESELKASGAVSVGNRSFAGSGATTPDVQAMPGGLNPAGLLSEAVSVERFAVGQGSTVKMNRTVYSDTTYTEASRRVTRATIGTTAVDLTGEQVALTIERFAGPYSSGASAVGPHVIEDFDLDKANDDLIDKVQKHLRRDRMKFVDSVVALKLLTAPAAATTSYCYPGDPNLTLSSDDSAFLSAGDRSWDLESCFRAEQMALDAKIPTFANGRYCAVISPKQQRQMKTNSRYEKMVQFHTDKNPIYSKYIGTIGMTDFFVSQTNPTATANSTITVQRGVLFGPGVLAYGIGSKGLRVQPSDDTNFGQRVSLLWMADEGFQVLDNRFAISLRSD
jgi:hypothetical protein